MRRCGLAGLALAVLLGGVRADDKKGDKGAAVKKEWKRLNGTWEVVRAVIHGKKDPYMEGGEVFFAFKDGRLTSWWKGWPPAEAAVKVDPATAPKSMDVTFGTGLSKGKPQFAVYAIKGGGLRVCFAPRGKPRPKALESKAGSGHRLFTFKRAKPKD